MIGTTVGGYEITELLAEGGMGAVWAAKHTVMEREAVVKLLRPELGQDPEIVERFINEARAAASINDPGIVQVFDVGNLEDGRPYIVMERLGGQTLAARLKQRVAERPTRTRATETVSVLRLIARTLVAAHNRGIIHRDLKPDNIFLVSDPDVAGGERTKIVDFGIAKLATGMAANTTRAGSMFGTPAYMAPEQCSDAGSVDARADLYAVGCIGYEMLTGKPPFVGSGFEVIASQLRDDPVSLREKDPAIPESLAEIVMRLLHKDPAERFAKAADLYEALDKLKFDRDDLVTPLPFPKPPDQIVTAPARPSAKVEVDVTAATQMSIASAATSSPPPPESPSIPPSHTTLGGAAGASQTAPAVVEKRGPWRVIGAVLLVGAAAAITLVIARGGGTSRPTTLAATQPSAVEPAPSPALPPTVETPAVTPASVTPPAVTPPDVPPVAPLPSRVPSPKAPRPTTLAPTTTPTPVRPTTTPPAPPSTPERAPTGPEPSPTLAPAPDLGQVQQLGTPGETTTTPGSPGVQPLGPRTETPVETPPMETLPPPAPKEPRVIQVNAGPIWDNNDSKKKCPAVCKAPRTWNGQWHTVEKAKQSVCDCELK